MGKWDIWTYKSECTVLINWKKTNKQESTNINKVMSKEASPQSLQPHFWHTSKQIMFLNNLDICNTWGGERRTDLLWLRGEWHRGRVGEVVAMKLFLCPGTLLPRRTKLSSFCGRKRKTHLKFCTNNLWWAKVRNNNQVFLSHGKESSRWR